MILCVMSAKNYGIIELLIQASPNIIKRKIRKSTRLKAKSPKIVEPISHGNKRMRAPPQIVGQT